MRWLIGVLLVGACGGGDEGAILTIRAPSGPASASRIELVLANAAANTMATTAQRVQPGSFVEGPARYFRQRAEGGFVEAVAQLDGFAVRIERDAIVAAENDFVPFVIARGSDDAITGIGAVLDANGTPASISVAAGQLAKYTVDMTPVSDAGDKAAIAPSKSRVVLCPTASSAMFTSGVAWQPAKGPQLRLLLPDAGATDATARELDMDCDRHEAMDDDCDDLRGDFHDGAQELCDGLDTNCDGRRNEVVACDLQPGVCGAAATTGVELCLDTDGGHPGTCRGDAACLCGPGNPGPCTKCILDFKIGGTIGKQAPCTPSVGKLTMEDCDATSPCTVEVIGVTGPWRAFVAAAPDGNFADKAAIATNTVFLEVKVEVSELTAQPGGSVGAVYLVKTQNAQITPIAVDLELGNLSTNMCQDAGSGRATMACSP